MSDHLPGALSPARSRADVPARRRCLRCQSPFDSEGFGDRICKRCKASALWRTALPPGDGHARRRQSRSSG